MSQYVYLKQADGQFLKLLADDDGIIQYTTNGDSFDGILAEASGVVTAVTGPSVDNSVPTAPVVKAPNGWTLVSVPSNAQNVDITVAGDTAIAVEVYGVATNNNGSLSTYTVQPNNVTANQSSVDIGCLTGAAGGTNTNTLQLGYADASGGFCAFHFTFFTKSGQVRSTHGSYAECNPAGAMTFKGHVAGVWADTATAITSIRLHSDRSDGFKAGSYILWRAIPMGA